MLLLTLGAGLLSAVAMLATSGIPAGTALPVTLNSTLDARKDKPGEKIQAKLMQDIPLSSGEKIKGGARVTGHIVEVTKLPAGGSRMVLKFDELQDRGTAIPLNVSARAIAAMESVYAAEIPIDATSDSESSNQWVMRQVGGEIVNRGRGRIASGEGLVGRWNGQAWGKLTAGAEGDCTAADGNGIEQALWVFSTSACGLYGLEGMTLAHDGRTAPLGQIVLESSKSLHVGGGSGWFLLVNAAAPAAP